MTGSQPTPAPLKSIMGMKEQGSTPDTTSQHNAEMGDICLPTTHFTRNTGRSNP